MLCAAPFATRSTAAELRGMRSPPCSFPPGLAPRLRGAERSRSAEQAPPGRPCPAPRARPGRLPNDRQRSAAGPVRPPVAAPLWARPASRPPSCPRKAQQPSAEPRARAGSGPPPAGTCRLRRPQALHLSCFLPRAPEVRPPRGGVSAPSALRDWVARLSLKGRARPLALLCHHGGNMAAPPSPLCQGEVVAPSLLQNELYSDLQLYSVTWTSADLYRLL